MPIVAAAQAQVAVGEDAPFEEGVELNLCDLRYVGPSSIFGLCEEGRGVPLHWAARRGLFRAVALLVDWGAVLRPLGLPADGLHARLPTW
jgi:hypothetical protein